MCLDSPVPQPLNLDALAAKLNLPNETALARSADMDLGGRSDLRINLMYNPNDVTTANVVGAEVRHDAYGLLRLERFTGGDLLDIGSHGGAVAILLAKTQPHVRVHAFEPSPLNYFYLVWNIHRNGVAKRVIPRNIGLSGQGGTRSFLVSSQDTTGNRMSTNVNGTWNADLWGDAAFKRTVTIQTVRLDEFLDACGLQRATIPFMKLDCEGCEYEIVPPNSKFFLHQVRHIAGELHTTGGGTSIEQAQKLTKQVLCVGRKSLNQSLAANSTLRWDTLQNCNKRTIEQRG